MTKKESKQKDYAEQDLDNTRKCVDKVINAAMAEGLHGLYREKDAQKFIRKVTGAIMYADGDESRIINDAVVQFIYTCFRNNIILDCKLEKPLL